MADNRSYSSAPAPAAAILLAGLLASLVAPAADHGDDGITLVGPVETLETDGPGGFLLGTSFGVSIRSNEDWLVVPAPREENIHGSNGVLRIYRRNPDSGAPEGAPQVIEGLARNIFGDRLGSSVQIQDGFLFVGVGSDPVFPGGDMDFAGKVYVYVLDENTGQWEGPVQELTSDDPQAWRGFGGRTEAPRTAVFAFGNGNNRAIVLAVGEGDNLPEGDPPENRIAAVHLFASTGDPNTPFERIQKIPMPVPSAPFANPGFGDDLIRAGKRDLIVTDDTTVYLYRNISRTGKNPNQAGEVLPDQTIVLPGDPDPACEQGAGPGQISMAAAEDILVVARPCADIAVVYAMRGNRYQQVQVLDPLAITSDGIFGAQFFGGGSETTVSTDGETIVIGSTVFDDNFVVTETMDPPGVIEEGEAWFVSQNAVHIYKRLRGNGGVGGGSVRFGAPVLLDDPEVRITPLAEGEQHFGDAFGFSVRHLGQGWLAVGENNLPYFYFRDVYELQGGSLVPVDSDFEFAPAQPAQVHLYRIEAEDD
jgi:hypothetical protein